MYDINLVTSSLRARVSYALGGVGGRAPRGACIVGVGLYLLLKESIIGERERCIARHSWGARPGRRPKPRATWTLRSRVKLS